jgi:hypothetical protein
MTFRVLDPTPEKAPPAGQLAPRLATLDGKTIGFISNGKEGTKGFFAHLDRLLREEHGVAKVVMRTKSNYSAPADAHIVAEIRNWDAVISGIGDCGSCSSCSLHDSVTAERLNIPAFSVMTERFASAAELMSRVLGMPDYRFAKIGHPVSSATDKGLEAMARMAIEQGRSMIVRS